MATMLYVNRRVEVIAMPQRLQHVKWKENNNETHRIYL